MNKVWVVCIDGTWNAPGETDLDPIDKQEVITKTNVQITWEAFSQQTLDDVKPYGSIAELSQQSGKILYLNGVGSRGSELAKKFEGTTGAGTTERIVDAYRFLAERWQTGDKIFGFAFSRGAFALRSLVGFIDYVGLPKHPRLVGDLELFDLLNAYRDKKSGYTKSIDMQSADIYFVGVWETVGALALTDSLSNFHQESPNNIQHFRQALALDEQRKEFLPVYFDAKKFTTMKECWFVGAHSNVGGGYVDSNLSNIALFWMLNEAQKQGLLLDLSKIPGWKSQQPDGEIRNSYLEFWNSISVIGKLVEKFNWEKVNRKIRSGQLIHESVLVALKQNYKPDAIPPSGETIRELPVEKWFE
jgi:uncharacterized protein (DUF2235 family)